MSEVTFEIVKIIVCAVVSVAAILFTKVVIPYLKTITLTEQQKLIFKEIKKAVRSAEQTIRESGQGKAKKAQVISMVSAWMGRHGIDIYEDQLDALIEAAVFCMNHGDDDYDEDI